MTPEERLERRVRLAEAMGRKWYQDLKSHRYFLLAPQVLDETLHWVECERPDPMHFALVFGGYWDFDNDPAALLSLMEWIRTQDWFLELRILPTRGSNIARVRLAFKTDDEFGTDEAHCKADTLTEAVLVAIDEAIKRGKENSSSTP